MKRLLPPLLVALLLAYLQLRAGAQGAFLVAAVSAVFAYVVMASGRLLLLAAGGGAGFGPSAVYASGLLATCLGVYAMTAALPLTAAHAFGMLAVIVVGLELALRRRRPEPPLDRAALAGFALCVAFTAAWCVVPAGAYDTVRTQGFLPVWSDYFFHGGLISQFGDARALGRGSIYLAGAPSSFYHFGSYAGAAALAGMLDLPGLLLATSAWLPLGFLAMLAGACTLGSRLAGPAGELAALAALAILPDASNYALRNGWFSFHFTLFAHAGATYALGAAFLSLAFLERWSAERARAALIASALLAMSALLFRAHVFLLLVPAWIAAAALCTEHHPLRRRRLAWLAVIVLGAGAAATGLVLTHLADTGAGHWRLGGSALGRFFTIVHSWQEPTAYTGLYDDLAEFWPPYVALVGGVLLAVVAGLGAIVVLLPTSATLAGRAGVLRPIDSACLYLLFCWLLLMLFAPTPWHGEASDLIHRPFVLVYGAGAIWTLCLALRAISVRPGAAKALRPALLACCLLGLPWIVASADKFASPKFHWGEYDAAAPVPRGLVEAAGFLRQHAAPGDVFAPAGLSRHYKTFDFATQLCSLSGMPAYLSRPYIEMTKDGPRKALVATRFAALEEVAALADHRAAMRALRALKVQWYVVAAESGPRWDPDRRRAAFRAGQVALYAVAAEPSGTALQDDVRIRDADEVVMNEAAHLREHSAGERLVRPVLAHVAPPVE